MRGLGWHPASSPRLFLHLRPIASPEVRADVFSVNPVGANLALSDSRPNDRVTYGPQSRSQCRCLCNQCGSGSLPEAL